MSGLRLANYLFGPSGDWRSTARRTRLKDPSAWKAAEERYLQILDEKQAGSATGQQYLIIGCGFVGKRIVRRLLERGEKKIRIFDVNPNHPFANTKYLNLYGDCMEYIVGDVTKLDDVLPACKGVQVVYATFALLRFMDRLDHQARKSYQVNVVGTEVFVKALQETIVDDGQDILVVLTSSSHAVTDRLSLPRFNRTEDAPYVSRKDAHNHYQWTKALAEQFALSQHGSCNGKLHITAIRPCSGIFGADDSFNIEQCLDTGIAEGLGASAKIDWVYVENVALGHLLAEAALRREVESVASNPEGPVGGEAFNISNDDALRLLDFWSLAISEVKSFNLNRGTALELEFSFKPISLLWILAYISEGVQWWFKGKVSLGELDQLTPATIMTAEMSYSYLSTKASRVLGYKPAYSLDEAIQKSVEEYYEKKMEKMI